MDPRRAHVVYVGNTVRRLVPFLETLLAHTTWHFTTVANGCTAAELELLGDVRERFGDRVEVRVVSTDVVLGHGEVIARLLADETSPWFCCIDSDVFATRPIVLDELLPADGEAATCSCLPMWQHTPDEVMPEGFDYVSGGHYLRTSNGTFLGCTYAFCYRTDELRSLVERWGIPLQPCGWDALGADVRTALAARGLRGRRFDTMVVANVLLQRPDRPMVYRDIAGLFHLGAQSGLAERVSIIRRPLRHVAWRWFSRGFGPLWRARGFSRAESASIVEFARRRGEAVRFVDALAAGRARYERAPAWVGERETFDALAALLGRGAS